MPDNLSPEFNLPNKIKSQSSFWQSGLTLVIGFLTGIGAGLLGVGGGEFRMPYLMWIFKKDAKTAAAVNMTVGCFTVVFAFVKRWGSFSEIQPEHWIIGIIFALVSLAGSYWGVKRIHLISSRVIGIFIYIYLIFVGCWMIFESFYHTDFIDFELGVIPQYFLAGITGFLIAAISVGLGVAGGEMRIPLLMYIFGLPIKIAGTISLLASVPTVLTGAVTYKNLGYLPLKTIVIAVVMTIGSLAGIILGVYILAFVDKFFLTGLLGTILLLACLMMLLAGFPKNPKH